MTRYQSVSAYHFDTPDSVDDGGGGRLRPRSLLAFRHVQSVGRSDAIGIRLREPHRPQVFRPLERRCLATDSTLSGEPLEVEQLRNAGKD